MQESRTTPTARTPAAAASSRAGPAGPGRPVGRLVGAVAGVPSSRARPGPARAGAAAPPRRRSAASPHEPDRIGSASRGGGPSPGRREPRGGGPEAVLPRLGRAAHRPRDLRRHRGPRPGGPPGRGLWRRRRPRGQRPPERFIPMLNAARSPTFYEFDSGDLLKLYREMDDRDEEPVVIYHSHTATEAYPSRTDISYASEPNAHYVLVSTRHHGAADRAGRRRGRVPQLPDRRRRGDRGGRRGRRVLPVRPLADHRRLRLKKDPPAPHRSQARGGPCRRAGRRAESPAAAGRCPAQTHHPLPSRSAPNPPEENRTPWPSRSGSRPSCAPTPAAQDRRGQRRHPRRARRRPRQQAPRPEEPPGHRGASCTASSTSTSTTRTCASPVRSTPRSRTATR
jgi:proteasome lid subunit RPN8/RPN11